MSTVTISDLHFLKREELASLLSSPSSASQIAVIDVRDSDHVGGHIKSSEWVPVHTLDSKLPELIRTLKDKEKVVFHCALSQQRGPSSALRYARERAQVVKKDSSTQDEKEVTDQQICVLEGGFLMWQAKYGKDEKLTEAYAADLWDDN